MLMSISTGRYVVVRPRNSLFEPRFSVPLEERGCIVPWGFRPVPLPCGSCATLRNPLPPISRLDHLLLREKRLLQLQHIHVLHCRIAMH